jgi:hypothetical protein
MVAPITAVYDDTIHEEGTVLLGTPALNLTRKTADVEMEITGVPLVSMVPYDIDMCFVLCKDFNIVILTTS